MIARKYALLATTALVMTAASPAKAIDFFQPSAESNFSNNVKQAAGNLQDERGQKIREFKSLRDQAQALIQEAKALSSSADKDDAKRKELAARIDGMKDKIAAQQAKYQAVAAASDEARRKKPFWHIWDTEEEKTAKKEFKELEAIEKEQAQLTQDLEQARQNAEFSVQAAARNVTKAEELNKRADSMHAQELRFLNGRDPASMSAQEQSSLVSTQEQTEIAERTAEQELQRMRGSFYDAKFLLMDLDTLKARNQLTDAHLQGLKNKLQGQLDNTLMGKYIDKKVNDALAKVCEMKNACTNFGGIADSFKAVNSRSPSKSLGSGPLGEDEMAPQSGPDDAMATGAEER